MTENQESQTISRDDVATVSAEELVGEAAKAGKPVTVSAVGVSVNTIHGDEINERLQRAMNDEILKCNAEGISTEEKNSATIKDRMMAAHARELNVIEQEGKLLTPSPRPQSDLDGTPAPAENPPQAGNG